MHAGDRAPVVRRSRRGRRFGCLVALSAAALLTFFGVSCADTYDRQYWPGISWAGSAGGDTIGVANYAMSDADGEVGIMRVFASANAIGQAEAWASVQTLFTYDHDHDWINDFEIEYSRLGLFERAPNGESDFYVKAELYDADADPETLLFTALDGRLTDHAGHVGTQTRSIKFSCFLRTAGNYRLVVTAYARCWVAPESEGSTAIDCYTSDLESRRIDVSWFSVHHSHRWVHLSGGYGGVSASYAFAPKQQSFDWASGVSFETTTSDPAAGNINGWWTQLMDFDAGTSSQQTNKKIAYSAWIDEGPSIPRSYTGYLYVTHYLQNSSSSGQCHNYCSLQNLVWQEAQPGASRATSSRVVPDHGWEVFDPVQLPEYPGKWVHPFRLVNEDPASVLRVSSLSFRATTADSQNLAAVEFPDTIQYDFVLQPLEEWSLSLTTDDTLYGGFIYFKLGLFNPAGDSIVFHSWGKHEIVRPVAAVHGAPDASAAVSLRQNYPNPFNPSTAIAYAISRDCRVSLDVYDIAGRKIVTLVDRLETAGEHSARWDGCDGKGRPVASGIYVCKLKADGFVDSRKMLLLR